MRDAIVVGAGLAGSSAAAALSAHGWDVLLLERDTFPRHKVCGEFLSPEARQSLHALGVLEAVAEQNPVELVGAELASGHAKPLPVDLPGVAWGISRYAMDASLAQAAIAQGAELWQAATVQHVERQSDGLFEVIGRRQGEAFAEEARLVLLATGRAGGAKLPPGRDARSTGGWRSCVGVKAHYTNVEMPAHIELYLYEGGYVGINPVEGGRSNVCLLVQTENFQRTGADRSGELRHAAAQTGLGKRLENANICSESLTAVAAVDTQRRPQPVWQSSMCIGDVAAMIPPLCGDGMAMALRAAELSIPLAHRYLSGDMGMQDMLTHYQRDWQHEFQSRLHVGQSLQWALGLPYAGSALLSVGQVMPRLVSTLARATRGTVHA